jgi:predicted kinase
MEGNMGEKILLLLAGLPRSGKSTWAIRQGLPIVNRDAIRLAVHGVPYIQATEPMIGVIEEYMVKSLFLAGNFTVVVDATHVSEKRRKRWKYIAEDCDVSLRIKVFPVPKDECVLRAKNDGREDLVPVIERMADNWDLDECDIPEYSDE